MIGLAFWNPFRMGYYRRYRLFKQRGNLATYDWCITCTWRHQPLLVPVPKVSGPQERPENKPSYLFNGAVNTTEQGQPIPLLYGELIVGSAVVSAGLTDKEIPIRTNSTSNNETRGKLKFKRVSG